MKKTFNASQDVMDLAGLFDDQSILEIVGVERKEIRHSRFLQWFFNNPSINTRTKHAPFNHLMDLLIQRDCEQHAPSTISDCLRTAVLNRTVIFSDIKATIEVPTKGVKIDGKTGSIDLVIRCNANYNNRNSHPLTLVIENKVDSPEHDHQVWNYYYYMTGETVGEHDFTVDIDNRYDSPKTQDEEQIFVFLSPIDQYKLNNIVNSDERCECSEHYTHISYQDLVDIVLTPVIEYNLTPKSITNNLSQYISSLGIVNKVDERNYQDFPVMAVSRQISTLSNRIWQDYKNEIKNWICNNDDFATSYKNFLIKLLNAVAKTILDVDDWKLASVLKLKLMSPNYRLVEITENGNSSIHIFNLSTLPIEFAKLYYRSNNFSTINQLQLDFNSVSEQLFYDTCQISQTNGPTTAEVATNIWMKKNIWNSSPKNDGYLKKLMKLIDMFNTKNVNQFNVL